MFPMVNKPFTGVGFGILCLAFAIAIHAYLDAHANRFIGLWTIHGDSSHVLINKDRFVVETADGKNTFRLPYRIPDDNLLYIYNYTGQVIGTMTLSQDGNSIDGHMMQLGGVTNYELEREK